MKKVILYSSMSLIALLLMSSCSTVSKTGYVAPFNQTCVYTDSIKADMSFNQQKVTGEAQSWYFLIFRLVGDNKYTEVVNGYTINSLFGTRTNKVREAAMYNALSNSNGDLLANPQYDTKIQSYLFGIIKGYKVKVSGYEGKINKIYQVTSKQ